MKIERNLTRKAPARPRLLAYSLEVSTPVRLLPVQPLQTLSAQQTRESGSEYAECARHA